MSRRHTDARLLVAALRDPDTVRNLDDAGWNALLTMARAEVLGGSLAARLAGQPVPARIAAILGDIAVHADHQRRSALWEAECAKRALRTIGGKIVLLKGTAYAAAGLDAGIGRSIGDLDILVPERSLRQVETLLLAAEWEWVKQDAYDDQYYRKWMHELPPMIHRTRDRMIDVHHNILPRTAGPSPDATAMIDAAIALHPVASGDIRPDRIGAGCGLYVLAPADMVIHSIAHLFADGDLAGGLRNLWDIDRMLHEFAARPDFHHALRLRADRHGLRIAFHRAIRIVRHVYGTPIDHEYAGALTWIDRLFIARMMARDGWGRPTMRLLRFGFYIRGHLLRMPPRMLARHLWTKWRKQGDKKRLPLALAELKSG